MTLLFKPQISPLRYAPVEMTNISGVVLARTVGGNEVAASSILVSGGFASSENLRALVDCRT